MRSWAGSGSERRTRVSRSMRCTKANSPVCVVEYRVVRIGLFRALWQGGSGPQLGSARKFASGAGVVGRGRGGDSDSEEDDSEDDFGERLPAVTPERLRGWNNENRLHGEQSDGFVEVAMLSPAFDDMLKLHKSFANRRVQYGSSCLFTWTVALKFHPCRGSIKVGLRNVHPFRIRSRFPSHYQHAGSSSRTRQPTT